MVPEKPLLYLAAAGLDILGLAPRAGIALPLGAQALQLGVRSREIFAGRFNIARQRPSEGGSHQGIVSGNDSHESASDPPRARGWTAACFWYNDVLIIGAASQAG